MRELEPPRDREFVDDPAPAAGINYGRPARRLLRLRRPHRPLTHVAVTEHLYPAGFDITTVTPRFLPYSFRGLLPPSPLLTRTYLRTPALWRLLGKQFLVIARKSPTPASATRPTAQALSLR
jgi:hypothetical protein